MTIKHTPGPWRIGEPHSKNACVYVVAGNWNHDIATLYGNGEGSFEDGVWTDQPIRDANARLIAAAPDLLEVVKDIVSDGKDVMNPGLYALAVAALAKAEGRE